MVRFILRIKDNSNLDNIDQVSKNIVSLTAQDLWTNVKKETPVDEGKAQGSWMVFNDSDNQKTISSSANYIDFLDKGTGLYGPLKHKIYPKNGKYLSFVYKGKKIAVPWTRGMKPHNMVKKSIESTSRRLPSLCIKAVQEAGL